MTRICSIPIRSGRKRMARALEAVLRMFADPVRARLSRRARVAR